MNLNNIQGKKMMLLISGLILLALAAGFFAYGIRSQRIAEELKKDISEAKQPKKLDVQKFLPAKATVERKIDVDLNRDGTKEILVAFKLGKGASRDYLMLLTVKNDRYEKVYQRKLQGKLVKILIGDLHDDGSREVIVYYKRPGRYGRGESKSGILVFAFRDRNLSKEWGREWFDDEPKAANIRLIKVTNPERQAIVLRSLSAGASGYTESVGIYGWKTKKGYTELFSIDFHFGHGESGSFKFLKPDKSGVPIIETTEVTDTIGDYGAISVPIGWRITTWKWNGLRYVEKTQKTRFLDQSQIEKIRKLQEEVDEDKLDWESYWEEVEKILPPSLPSGIKL